MASCEYLIWYEETALPGYDPGIFAVKSDGKMLYAKCRPDVGTEIVDVIASRNSKCITARLFAYDGKEFDAFQNSQGAANLYRMLQR